MERSQVKTDDEYYFSCYLDELKKRGYVLSYLYEPYPIEITEGLKNPYTKRIQLKTKVKEETSEQIILKGSVYTPDFLIHWLPKGRGIFYDLLYTGNKITCPFIANNEGNKEFSFVECKPDFDANNMTRLFINNQKIIWDKYEKFINLIVNKELFKATFTPDEFLLTPTGKNKKLNYEPLTLRRFLNKTNRPSA